MKENPRMKLFDAVARNYPKAMSVKFNRDTFAVIDEIATEKNIPKSKVVRLIVKDFIDQLVRERMEEGKLGR